MILSAAAAAASLLLITPVHNEVANIERVIRSVAAQTRPPDRWLVVDDGSSDGTAELLDRLQAQSGGFEVLAMPPAARRSRDRLADAYEARAFNHALAHVGDLSAYTHVGKLDGDIELPDIWFERLLDDMAQNPRLGITGGQLIERRRDRDHLLRIPRYHVHGAVKLFTTDCLRAIGGIRETLAWDTIDETCARMGDYQTDSSEALVARHLRPMASADGQLRGRARLGTCAWILHYPIWWTAIRALRIAAVDSPRMLAGCAFALGYLRGLALRVPRVRDTGFATFTRAELRGRAVDEVRRYVRGAARARAKDPRKLP